MNVEPPIQFRRRPTFPSCLPFTLPRRLPCFVDLTNMNLSPEELNRLCKRFRVLIIGRRNAGKTTLLERMTGSGPEDMPEIRDEDGKLVVGASLI